MPRGSWRPHAAPSDAASTPSPDIRASDHSPVHRPRGLSKDCTCHLRRRSARQSVACGCLGFGHIMLNSPLRGARGSFPTGRLWGIRPTVGEPERIATGALARCAGGCAAAERMASGPRSLFDASPKKQKPGKASAPKDTRRMTVSGRSLPCCPLLIAR
jgi:hypothetical protein